MTPSATFLQIDLQSLFGPGQKKIDFDKVWEHFNDREAEFLTGAVIYIVRSSDFNSSRFETKLRSIGYDLRIKTLSKTRKKYYYDNSHIVSITIDCMSRLDRFDKWILMSNRVDFTDLCKYLRGIGKKIELWSFKDSYEPDLEPYVDRICFIEDKFCLQKPSVSVFGANWGLEKFDSTSSRK